MNKIYPRVIGLEAPYGRGVGIDYYDVPANRDLGNSLCTIPHWCVGIAAVDDLELVAVHMPRVPTTVEIIDHNFDTLFRLLAV